MPTTLHTKLSLLVKTSLILTLLIQISDVCAAEPGEHMKAGQQLFQTKMYKAAISEFEQATIEQPNDATAHYYLAVSHVHAGNISQAYPHFQQAIGLSADNSQIHQMASTALAAYHSAPAASEPAPTAASSGPLLPSKSFNGGASAELDKAAAGGGYSPSANQSAYTPTRNFSPSNFSQSPQALYPQNFNHIPGYHNSGAWGTNNGSNSWGASRGSRGMRNYNYNNPQSSSLAPTLAIYNSNASPTITKDMTASDQALSMIKRQSDRQVQMASTGARMEFYAPNTRDQINQINQNANAQINKMLTPTWHYGRRGGFYSSATQAQIDAVNYQAQSNIFNLRRETDKAENVRQVQQATTEAASNLSDQIRNQKLTGSGVMLRPEGTNLNVRNYETFHSDQDDRDAILPMVAHPMTLKEAEKSMPLLPPTVPTKHYSIDQ